VPSPTGYTTAVDLWSLGVIIHGLLYGTHEELTWYLHQGDFRHLNTCTLSDLAKDFIKKLLCIDPKKRMTAKEAMEHRWLSNHEEKLEVLYQKATKNWKGESAIVLDGILNIDSDVEDEEPSEQLSNDSGRSDISMRDVPVLVSMESPSSLGGSELEASGWANIQEDQLLYDSVARDGKLRTAAQLAREAESMRAGKKDLSGLWPKLPLPSPRKRVDTETSMEIETDLDETSMHSRHGSYYSDY
jgi:serine/threonine protein kinase